MAWRKFLCRLRRHAVALHMAEHRIWLRCELCGYETPGWSLVPRPPQARSTKLVRFMKRLAA